jgi:UDP-glucose 4-epimerase
LKVLLTGGCGYIGGRLAQMMSTDAGYELVLGTRRPAGAPPWAPHAAVVRTDWASEPELARVCRGMDAIVHLAGMNAADCARDPVAALEFNAVGTARLMRAALDSNVRRFLYLSTLHVYGAALVGSVNEETRPEPRHPYATSHRAAEDVVCTAHAANRIQGIVIRLANAFGAPVDPASDCWSLAINDLCRQAVQTRSVALRTTGLQRRDFMPLSEAGRAIVHLLNLATPQLGDGVFNVGSGWAPTLLEAAEAVAAAVEEVFGYRPRVHAGTCADAVGRCSLDFSVQRLLASGFDPQPGAKAAELRRLIEFCVQHAAHLPK